MTPRFSLVALIVLSAGCLLEFEDPPSGSGGEAPISGPSCKAEDAPCGAKSCCEAPTIPGGSFARGYDRTGSATQPGSPDPVLGFQSGESAPATVSGFRLDAYEVTVRRFRRFMDAYEAWRGAGHPKADEGANPKLAASGWSTAFDAFLPSDGAALEAAVGCEGTSFTSSSAGDDKPINCVSWYVAFAFCIWDEGRLPTEAEWNFAAAGGDEQRAFPWSVPPEELLIDSVHAAYGDVPIATVGSRADTDTARFGHHDLAGNVREWVLDSGGDLDQYPFTTGCEDCASLVEGDRVRRGGDFGADAARARTAYRSVESPELRSQYTGVRCAR